MTTSTLPKEIPATYDALAGILIPRPVHDKVDYANAIEIVDWLAGRELNRDQEDYLEAISTFVEAYEAAHYPMGRKKISPLRALKYLLDEHGMSGSDLGRLLGARTLGAAILRGDRQLSKEHIKKLSEHFKVDAGLFLS
ncbi:MAG: transcriptional regulator [Phycisphaerae bacterium]|nr:transcriptional regulator [Phycisphaerae bacterium]